MKPGKNTNEKPISLAPLSFEEAVRDLLKIKPEPKAPKPAPKVRTKAQGATRVGR